MAICGSACHARKGWEPAAATRVRWPLPVLRRAAPMCAADTWRRGRDRRIAGAVRLGRCEYAEVYITPRRHHNDMRCRGGRPCPPVPFSPRALALAPGGRSTLVGRDALIAPPVTAISPCRGKVWAPCPTNATTAPRRKRPPAREDRCMRHKPSQVARNGWRVVSG